MQIEPRHERFGPPSTDDGYFAETSWWSAWVPERRLSLSVYSLFRTNTGVCSNRIDVWDGSTEASYEAPYSRQAWHMPIPDGAEAGNYALANGLTLERVDPLRRYRMRYEDEDRLRLDLTFDGVHPPHPLRFGEHLSHFDQPMHVTGVVRVLGEDLPVDCYSIRDHSWHVRSELGAGPRNGYTYAMASPGEGFHVISIAGPSGEGEERVIGGYLVRDGVMADVVSGVRTVTKRERGRPVAVAVDVTDSSGRTLRADGECVNTYAWQSWSPCLAWFSLTRFSMDDGTQAWGEDQDCWPHTAWAEVQRRMR